MTLYTECKTISLNDLSLKNLQHNNNPYNTDGEHISADKVISLLKLYV